MVAERDKTSGAEAASLISDPRWALVERVSASSSLLRAPRLRELLRYLCLSAIKNPQAHITEQQIGVAVFERPVGYDTNGDTIVRVQVSQLRRKVEHYFLSDGRAEPVVFELPKGSYLPLFRQTAEASAAPAPSVPEAPAADVRAPRRYRWLAAVGTLVALAGILAAALRPRGSPASSSPCADHFWRQFLEGGDTQVVLSDASVTMLSELLGRPVTLEEYTHRSYPAAAAAELPVTPRLRSILEQAAVKGHTSSHDAVIANAIGLACARNGGTASIVSARSFRLDLARNVVLLGHRRANPWVALFDKELNFRYEFDDEKRQAIIENRSPRAGEEKTYSVSWGRKGHCVVAYVPKARGNGSALLVSGTDWLSVAAGGQFLTDEPSLADLHRRLGVGSEGRVPYFEVVLEAELTGGAATSYRTLAHRVVSRPTAAGR